MILELELGQWAENNQKVSGGMEILKDYREAQFGWIISGHAEQIQSFEKNSLSFFCVLYIIRYLGVQRWLRYTHCPGVCLTFKRQTSCKFHEGTDLKHTMEAQQISHFILSTNN